MRIWLTVTMCATLLGLANSPSPLLAQQKTMKACQDERRANRCFAMLFGSRSRTQAARDSAIARPKMGVDG
jgi:hypothetical protein